MNQNPCYSLEKMADNDTLMTQGPNEESPQAPGTNDLPVSWRKLGILGKLFASVLIPVAIAFVGAAAKSSIEAKNIGLHYIELAVGVLKEKPNQDTEHLRKWAIGVVNFYSTVPLTEAAKRELELKQLPIGNKLGEVFEQSEGFQANVYTDVMGRKVIGLGHILTVEEAASGFTNADGESIDYRNGITIEQARKILDADLKPIKQAIDELVTVPLTANQRDSLISFIWQVGLGNFKGSTVLQKLNSRKYEEVPAELRRWTKVGGKSFPLLEKRREKEIEIWNERASADK